MFAWLLFSNKAANHLLVLFCKRAEAAKKQCSSKGSDYNQHSNKGKPNDKETFFLLKNYTDYKVISIIMFRKKATNTSKAINTSFLSTSSKTFFSFCHKRFFNDALARKH